jgi:hypothetical protein
VAEEGAEGAHGVGDAAAALDDFLIGSLGVHVPLPSVFEGHDLRAGAGTVFFGEEDVVVLAAVEGRVEVDELDGLVLDVLTEDDARDYATANSFERNILRTSSSRSIF